MINNRLVVSVVGLSLGFVIKGEYGAQTTQAQPISQDSTFSTVSAANHDQPQARVEKMAQRLSRKGLAFLTRHEGLRLSRYKDAGGKWTIGYGHLINRGEDFYRITIAEAKELLALDVRVAEKAINQLVLVPLTQPQFDALVSLVYNIGQGAFMRSTLLSYINTIDPILLPTACAFFIPFHYVNGKANNGLMKRRFDEAILWQGRY